MPRPMNYTLAGGENSTKGGRGLGDSIIDNSLAYINSQNNAGVLATNSGGGDITSADIAFLNGQLNANVPNTGADFTATPGTLQNMVQALTPSSVSGSGTSGMLILAAIGLGIILLIKR